MQSVALRIIGDREDEINAFIPQEYWSLDGEFKVQMCIRDRIKAVGKIDPKLVAPDAEVIELNGRYVLPGFVNTHVHTSQQISRGVGDDVDFVTWLHKRMWPFESNMTEEDSYMSTLATCLELIRSGVTSFAEPGGQFVSRCV